jgi:hypothetical protein
MKRTFVLFFGLVLCAVAVAQTPINDPNVEVRQASNYHGIDVSNAFDVYLKPVGHGIGSG